MELELEWEWELELELDNDSRYTRHYNSHQQLTEEKGNGGESKKSQERND